MKYIVDQGQENEDNEAIIIRLQKRINDLLDDKDNTQRFIIGRKEAHLKMKKTFIDEIECK